MSGPHRTDGFAGALAAFEALRLASRMDPDLFVGRAALPRDEREAKKRARRIVQVLADASLGMPDRLAQVMVAIDEGQPRWHVAPLYTMRIGTGARMEGVADPFLRQAPISLDEWMAHLKVESVAFLFPEQLLAEAEALAPTTLRDRKSDPTTKRDGEGTEDDAVGLSRLLSAWLAEPQDPAMVRRFRALFGELTWQAFLRDYPEIAQQVDAELAKHAK
jgi:hypothetical protein